jgi:hypothetical protein
VGQAIEQRGGHFGIGEYARPFTEGEVGGDHDRGALIEPADEELTAGLRLVAGRRNGRAVEARDQGRQCNLSQLQRSCWPPLNWGCVRRTYDAPT